MAAADDSAEIVDWKGDNEEVEEEEGQSEDVRPSGEEIKSLWQRGRIKIGAIQGFQYGKQEFVSLNKIFFT